MTQIGTPIRTIEIEPLTPPVPREPTPEPAPRPAEEPVPA